MRHISVYLFLLFIIFTSCVKEEVIPVAGMWASVNEDKSVAKLIEFSNGAFIEYTPKNDTKFYYHDEKVWNATKEDFDVIKYPYCIEEDKLILDGSKTQTTISISSDVLTLDAADYKFVADFDSSYGSEIILNVPKLDNDYLEFSLSSQEIVWDYEISNIPMTTDLAVYSNVNWIKNFTVLKNQIRFNIDENTSSYSRSAILSISHPAAETINVTLIQLHAIYAAVVETCSPDQISYTQVTLKGNILEDGNGKIKSRGFYFGANPESLEKYVTESTEEDSYTMTIGGLQGGSVYYYKAFAENEAGEAYGETLSFTTLEYTVPSVVTKSASSISYTSAILNGGITNDGGRDITDSGFYYGKSQADMTKLSCGIKSGQFSAEIMGLEDGVTYYYQAYAVNSEGECNGDSMSFTTTMVTVPEVSTLSLSDVSYTTAKVSGSIDSDGGSTITEYGFYYCARSDEQARKIKVGTSIKGVFSTTLTDLEDGTNYYCYAYAINSEGVAHGAALSFATPKDPYNGHEYVDLGLPSGTKWATKNIGADSERGYGNYYQWGYDAAGIEWGGLWRTPTMEEWEELRNCCEWENYGTGWNVVGPNGNAVYLGLTGGQNGWTYMPTYNSGCYWSSSKVSQSEAYALIFSDYSYGSIRSMSISWELAIRPVVSE